MRPGPPTWLFWLGLAVFMTLIVLVSTGATNGLDHDVLRLCRDHRSSTLAAAARHLTDVFSPTDDLACLGIGAAGLARRRRQPRTFVVAALVAVVMAVVVLSTKVAVGRPLPDGSTPDRGGFPSGHTAAFLVCFGALALLATARRRTWRPPLLVAVAVGTVVIAAALVYDDYHWLTDTLGSIGLGISLLSALACVDVTAVPPDRRPPHP